MKAHARAPAAAPAKQDAPPRKTAAPQRAEPRAHEAQIDPTRFPVALRAIVDGRAAPASPAENGTFLVDIATGENQLHKSEFLAQLKAGVVMAAEQELAGTDWTAEHCPYIEYWFNYYASRSAADVEAALRKYAPASADATTANAYLEPALARVREAVRHWRATGVVDAPPAVVPQVVESMAELGVGRPLESSTRTRLEGALGADLSSTRIHDDALGARASADAGARAMTIGSHVAFAGGEYAPGTPHGDALLAHELAHTQQQRDATDVATSTDNAAAEAGADRFAGRALARLAGFATQRAALAPMRGLALQRCEDGYDPDFEYREGETRQQTWIRTFREDYPDLENVGHVAGERDEGIPTQSGIRVPKKKGNLLAPRPFYERWLGQFFAYQGFIHYAELIEAGHDAAATKIGQSLYSRTGEQVPKDTDLDLDSYDAWTVKAAEARDAVAFSLMVADLAIAMRGMWLMWRRPPPGVTSGTITAKPPTSTPDTPPPPKVVVEPQTPPKVTTEPPPKVTTESPPKVTTEPPSKVTTEPPKVTTVKTTAPEKPPFPADEFPASDKSWQQWPPPAPSKTRVRWDEPGGARWRYDRYRYNKWLESNKSATKPNDVKGPKDYFDQHVAPKAVGQSPGELGSPEHKAAVQKVRTDNNIGTRTMGKQRPDAVGDIDQSIAVGDRVIKPEKGDRVLYEADNFYSDGSQIVSEGRSQVRQFRADNPTATIVVQDAKNPKNIVVYEPGTQPPPPGRLKPGTTNMEPVQ